MKRIYQMTVAIEYVDEQKTTSAAPVGPSLRAACESAEVAIAAAIQSDASRSQTRKGIRVNVMRSEVIEEP